jgi:hypothetical protein
MKVTFSIKTINEKNYNINFPSFMHEPVTFLPLASPISAHKADLALALPSETTSGSLCAQILALPRSRKC